jgi:hypothetical protein
MVMGVVAVEGAEGMRRKGALMGEKASKGKVGGGQRHWRRGRLLFVVGATTVEQCSCLSRWHHHWIKV